MTKIPTFGFSAFLKVSGANEKPQKTEIKKRLRPAQESKSGYDFHKKMRHFARQLLLGNMGGDELQQALNTISKPAELRSAQNAIKRLVEWRVQNPGNIFDFHSVKYESPNSVFKINFNWDFGIELNGRRTAIHIWNTKFNLHYNTVLAILTLLPTCYGDHGEAPDDFAVLSLQDLTLYRWSEGSAEHKVLGEKLISHLEKNFELIKMQLDEAEKTKHGDLRSDLYAK